MRAVKHAKTTDGPSEACRPRRLASDKLKAAKTEFNLLLQEEIIRVSKSPWSTSHGAQKRVYMETLWRLQKTEHKNGARSLFNSVIQFIPYIKDFSQTLHGKKVFSTLDLGLRPPSLQSDIRIPGRYSKKRL